MSQLTLEHIPIQPIIFREDQGRGVCVCVVGGRGVYLKRPGNFSGLSVETSKVRIRKENAFFFFFFSFFFFFCEFSSKSCLPITEEKIG